jgi:hypothetical protein
MMTMERYTQEDPRNNLEGYLDITKPSISIKDVSISQVNQGSSKDSWLAVLLNSLKGFFDKLRSSRIPTDQHSTPSIGIGEGAYNFGGIEYAIEHLKGYDSIVKLLRENEQSNSQIEAPEDSGSIELSDFPC